MIDIWAERIVSMSEAAAALRRQGRKRTHPSTIYRWSKGLRGVRLETVMIGGAKHTSLEAIERFVQALTVRDTGSERDVASTSAVHVERTQSL